MIGIRMRSNFFRLGETHPTLNLNFYSARYDVLFYIASSKLIASSSFMRYAQIEAKQA